MHISKFDPKIIVSEENRVDLYSFNACIRLAISFQVPLKIFYICNNNVELGKFSVNYDQKAVWGVTTEPKTLNFEPREGTLLDIVRDFNSQLKDFMADAVIVKKQYRELKPQLYNSLSDSIFLDNPKQSTSYRQCLYPIQGVNFLILEDLDNYDWDEAFNYARSPDVLLGQEDINGSGFTREDVEEIIYLDEGENDGESWIGVFKLKDGRGAFLTAWCDYSGWGCQEGGNSLVAKTPEDILKYGLTPEEKERLGII